ncbi:MAG: DEAD/DEAH box helicase [Candidatus Gastranaerophilales bacterium]|nr:DEAD/DEAH box helicase [Candidatus Gastranaerophilales bacterium]
MTKLRFEELNLSEEILNAVKDMGFEETSPIQSEAIPLIISGKDMIGQAQTGTGKTAAFAIPVIEKINADSKELQAVILCPTRELVIQVSEEFRKLMKYKENLTVVPVYGGQEIERQLRTLRKGAQIVIGTPGRMMDHMRRGSIKMQSVETIVLDEADEMLDMGFRDDMEVILKDTPKSRQTVLFSATMAKDIIDLTGKYQKDPVIINVTHKKISSPKIQQIYFEVQEKNKPEVLARIIDLHNIKLALVFCNTKSQVDQVVDILKTRGYFADALHGDMSQNQRDRVMNGFRSGTIEILVATDVAGRGIDVNDVEAVFNYDLPRDDEDYTHRIGRTARAGKSGIAFTFIVGKQIYNLKRIERANGVQILRHNIPTMDELEATRISSYTSKVAEIIEEGHLSKYVNHIELLMGDEYTSLDVAAALLKITMEKENESFDSTVNFELPPVEVPAKKKYSDRSGGFNRSRGNNFKKNSGDKPFRSSGFKKNDSAKDDKPSGNFSGDRKRSFKKDSGESEYKPFRPSGFKRNDSAKDDRPSGNFSGDRKKSFSKSEFGGEYKPFKSAGKKRSDDKPSGKFNTDKKKSFGKFDKKDKK